MTEHRALVGNRLSFRRRATNVVACGGIVLSLVVALLPLFLVLGHTIAKGIKGISYDFLTHSMRGVGAFDNTGGVYHAILGTIQQVGIAFVIAVPFGLVVAVYLVEVGKGKL